jgi:hypothetical protein
LHQHSLNVWSAGRAILSSSLCAHAVVNTQRCRDVFGVARLA